MCTLLQIVLPADYHMEESCGAAMTALVRVIFRCGRAVEPGNNTSMRGRSLPPGSAQYPSLSVSLSPCADLVLA